jgi:hypothetical protein
MNVIKVISIDDIEEINQKIQIRQLKFPEDLRMSIGVVLMNFGDQFVEVSCIKGEWHGKKADLQSSSGHIPLCPAGHPLIETTTAPRLALIEGYEP